MARSQCVRRVPVATIRKHGKGYQAIVRRKGHPHVYKTLPLRGQAESWAKKIEVQILTGEFQPAKDTLGEAFVKYAEEVSPKKRGGRWEQYRLLADPIRLATMASKAIGSVTAADLSSWRDKRLRCLLG